MSVHNIDKGQIPDPEKDSSTKKERDPMNLQERFSETVKKKPSEKQASFIERVKRRFSHKVGISNDVIEAPIKDKPQQRQPSFVDRVKNHLRASPIAPSEESTEESLGSEEDAIERVEVLSSRITGFNPKISSLDQMVGDVLELKAIDKGRGEILQEKLQSFKLGAPILKFLLSNSLFSVHRSQLKDALNLEESEEILQVITSTKKAYETIRALRKGKGGEDILAKWTERVSQKQKILDRNIEKQEGVQDAQQGLEEAKKVLSKKTREYNEKFSTLSFEAMASFSNLSFEDAKLLLKYVREHQKDRPQDMRAIKTLKDELRGCMGKSAKYPYVKKDENFFKVTNELLQGFMQEMIDETLLQ
jgi:hypothetical protein